MIIHMTKTKNPAVIQATDKSPNVTFGLFATGTARAETILVNPGTAQRTSVGVFNLPGLFAIHLEVIIYLFRYYTLLIHNTIDGHYTYIDYN